MLPFLNKLPALAHVCTLLPRRPLPRSSPLSLVSRRLCPSSSRQSVGLIRFWGHLLAKTVHQLPRGDQSVSAGLKPMRVTAAQGWLFPAGKTDAGWNKTLALSVPFCDVVRNGNHSRLWMSEQNKCPQPLDLTSSFLGSVTAWQPAGQAMLQAHQTLMETRDISSHNLQSQWENSRA